MAFGNSCVTKALSNRAVWTVCLLRDVEWWSGWWSAQSRLLQPHTHTPARTHSVATKITGRDRTCGRAVASERLADLCCSYLLQCGASNRLFETTRRGGGKERETITGCLTYDCGCTVLQLLSANTSIFPPVHCKAASVFTLFPTPYMVWRFED